MLVVAVILKIITLNIVSAVKMVPKVLQRILKDFGPFSDLAEIRNLLLDRMSSSYTDFELFTR